MDSGFGIFLLLGLGFAVILLIGNIRLWRTMGLPGWSVIVPVWGTYVAFEKLGVPPLLALLDLVPYVGLILRMYLSAKIADAFGKPQGFIVFAALCSIFALAYLGFTEETFHTIDDPESPSQGFLND
jgi:hypothetical protein